MYSMAIFERITLTFNYFRINEAERNFHNEKILINQDGLIISHHFECFVLYHLKFISTYFLLLNIFLI